MLNPESHPNSNANFSQIQTPNGETSALVLNPKTFSPNALRSLIAHQIESIFPKEFAIMPKDRNEEIYFVTIEEIIGLKTLPEEERGKKVSDIADQMQNAETVLIMSPAPSHRDIQPALNSSKYSLQIRNDTVIETFRTQHLSEKELATLLERQAIDKSPKRITFASEYGNLSLLETSFEPPLDDVIKEAAQRSDSIIIEHNIFSHKMESEEH